MRGSESDRCYISRVVDRAFSAAKRLPVSAALPVAIAGCLLVPQSARAFFAASAKPRA